jgi:hypothetical protein
MTVGVAITLGAAIGLALGILISVTIEVPLAPEVGAGGGRDGRLAPEQQMSAATVVGVS